MRFVLHKEPNGTEFAWSLQGSPPDYPVLAVSPEEYADEKAARQSIHAARTAMRGYKFAKVVHEDDE